MKKQTAIKTIYNIVNTTTQQRQIIMGDNPLVIEREFNLAVNSNSLFKPEEYKLTKIGEWNSTTGEIKADKTETFIMNGKWEKGLDKPLEELIVSLVEKHLKK